MRKSGLTGDEAYILSKHGKTTEDLGTLKKEIGELKEDLEQLQNAGSGLTDTEKNLILTLFQNAVFTSDQSGNIEALYNLFTGLVVELSGISLSETTLLIDNLESKTLTARLKPNGATGTIVWTSSDESVATVTQTGVVKPLKSGNCTITATCENYSASCEIEVDLSGVIEITQDGTTLTILRAPNVTQDGSVLMIA